MLDRLLGLGVVVITCSVMSHAQSVSFSSPVPWVTQRNDTIVVRTQIDTAQIKQNVMSVQLIQIRNGEKKSIASRSISLGDISGEVSFGSIKKSIVGGNEYLQVEWSIPGRNEKGTIEPIGIVQENVLKNVKPISVKKVTSESEVLQISPESYQKLGDCQFTTAWNKERFFIAVKKTGNGKSVAKFSFDGKNGKSAFLSYPDKFISYSTQNDSVTCMDFKREITNNTISYKESVWDTEVSVQKQGEIVVISIPWFDTGIIPFDERTIGFGMFAESDDGTLIGAIPSTAKVTIPGTWTDVLLAK